MSEPLDRIIIDADLCIKLGNSEKYPFLREVLPLLAKDICIHACAYDEVKMPHCAVEQLLWLVENGKVKVVNETGLCPADRAVYEMSYCRLAAVMISHDKPNKNRGEACSLAYAKATGIMIFATDERNLQPIISSRLNIGINDIHCLRIIDIIGMAYNGDIDIQRKTAKALWIIAGKKKEDFDKSVWPLE